MRHYGLNNDANYAMNLMKFHRTFKNSYRSYPQKTFAEPGWVLTLEENFVYRKRLNLHKILEIQLFV